MYKLIITILLVLNAVQQSWSANVEQRGNLSLSGAKALAAAATRYAREHAAPGAAVAVVDAGGTLLYVERLDGTFQNAANISIGKARTAVLFGKPTRVFEDLVNKGRYTMLALPEIAPFTPLMGGVPVEIKGQIVGAIGVSGAASAAQDDEIASAAAQSFDKDSSASQEPAIFVPKTTVSSGFAKDAVLVERAEFKVSASHRDGPGLAEVHLNDTDIFYVISGNAELVVGGELIEPKSASPTEIRGSRIENGETHSIGPGEVITIPHGTPHWFKRVSTPFTYYVVKSTHQE